MASKEFHNRFDAIQFAEDINGFYQYCSHGTDGVYVVFYKEDEPMKINSENTTALDEIIDTLIANGMDYDEVFATQMRLAELDAEIELWNERGEYEKLADAQDELDELLTWLGADGQELFARFHDEINAYNMAYAI